MVQKKFCRKKIGLKILRKFGFRRTKSFKRITNFIKDRIANYSEGRNYPNTLGTSKLSPFIKFGQLHVETIWDECKKIKIKNIGISNFLLRLVGENLIIR